MTEFNKAKRAWYEETSTKLGVVFFKMGLRPNFWTAVSFLCGLVAGLFYWKGNIFWGIIFTILNMVTDSFDGATARAGNIGTVFGGILDHVVDRFAEFFILAGISLSGMIHPGWGFLAFFGMLSASYTRAAAESIGHIDNCAVGIMGRLEKLILVMVGLTLESNFPNVAWHGMSWLEGALIIVAATSYITSIQRLKFAAGVLKDKKWEDRNK